MMKIEKKILFIGKSNDIYTKQKIIKILKKGLSFLKFFFVGMTRNVNQIKKFRIGKVI